jgi:hypothetical protein
VCRTQINSGLAQLSGESKSTLHFDFEFFIFATTVASRIEMTPKSGPKRKKKGDAGSEWSHPERIPKSQMAESILKI